MAMINVYREDTLVAYQFGLEIESKLSGLFDSISGLGSESEVVEETLIDSYTGEIVIQKVPGRITWTDITLKRGVSRTNDVWEWRQQVVRGEIEDARLNCSIIAFNQQGEEVIRWNLEKAWPSKLSGPEMEAGGQNYMVEEITIVHQGLERVVASKSTT
jgi:phage tail-like protein